MCNKNKVNFLALQETKMNVMDDQCVRVCWGNLAFDFVHSAAVGNSGGILCVWDQIFFVKENIIVSDSLVILYGNWRPTGQKYLLIAVYAPHDAREKNMLWDYLHHVIDRWKGEVVIMGDFNESAKKMSKLDRFLVSKTLLNICPTISAVSLDRLLSDHRPILLREVYVDYGPIPFKCFHYWFDVEGFSKIVENGWKEYEGKDGNKMRYLMAKLKHLKSRIREWNAVSNVCNKKESDQCKRDLEAIDAIIDSGNGGEEEVCKRTDVINKLYKIGELKSKELAQKAKIKWAIEGDENSRFFHGMLNKKRNNLSVRGLMVDGGWVDDPNKVKKHFLNHFSDRFCKPANKTASIDMDFPKKISDDHVRDLEREVTNDEIKRAVWDCGTDKAPGPDGFTFGFYRRFWYLIHEDVTEAVRFFFLHSDIPKGCNSSFIALIPKIPNANLVNDFRPISLIGSLYKIIAKILANRITGVLNDLVNEVDFEKAYDSVRWDFVDEVLRKFGFGDKWCKWIQGCLTSSRGSIVVNGSPTEKFQFGRGLKQGDPLSPFLFILIMESLHLSFQRIVDACMFQGIKLGGGLVKLSHMFFADDAVFGLRINMSKSKILRVHVDSTIVYRAALKLGCLVLKIPFMYLGTIVGGNMSQIDSWDVVVEKVKKRLSNWKMKTLSVGGRLTLVKSVLGSMPLYHMSLFKAPSGVLNRIEALRNRFFHGHDSNSKRAIWVNWKKALTSKDRGGLGGYKSCWLVIVQEINALMNKGINVMQYFRRKIGNGEDTNFWEDKWCDGGKLKDKFHRLYALEDNKQITVGRKLAQVTLASSFRRHPRSGIEMEQFINMVNLIKETALNSSSD
ncbi:RNA-directed DNA polymerase, eukaryota, partial [Tanacetum coccineum]